MLAQQRQLDVAAPQPREPVAALGAEACDARAERVEPVDLDGLRLALELPIAERRHVDESVHQVEGRARDAHRAGLGGRLEPRGHVHRVAERAIGHRLALADLADDGGPGMDADAEHRAHAVACFKLGL